MSQQIPVSEDAVVPEDDGAAHALAPDVVYKSLGIVNVIMFGPPGAGDRGWVLIDAGLYGTKGMIQNAAAERFGVGARPAAIILTHGHFDHVGVLEDLAEEWDVPVYAHPLELPYLDGRAAYPAGDPSVGGGMMALLSRFYPRGPVHVAPRLKALLPDGVVKFMAGWEWIHTPGHSVGHVSLWREQDRLLIAGDAFVTTAQESAYAALAKPAELHGPPMYYTVEWDKAKASVATLAALEPEVVITGHGRPMRGEAMRQALHELAASFDTVAVPREGIYLARPARAEDGSAYVVPDA
jgi:glyoxylase-like metal-dependent hydrolase (beta-lactamase superfamily II)